MTETTWWQGQPVTGGIRVADLEAWWRAGGLADEAAVYQGPDIPNDPGAFYVVTMLPGAGFLLEQLLDAPSFQVRTVGPQHDPDGAHDLAFGVDSYMTSHDYPVLLGDTGQRRIVTLYRTGGAPSMDRIDNAERTHYVCTYVAEVSTV